MKKILVVDDSSDRMRWFEEMFYDCYVSFCPTVESSLLALKNDTFDFIFLDHDLGEKGDGRDITKEMKKENLAPYATIIIHSMNVPAAMQMIEDLHGRKTSYTPYSFLRSYNRTNFGLK